MIKLAHQLPSCETDTIAQTIRSYFCIPTRCNTVDTEHNEVFVNEANGEDDGPKQFTSNKCTCNEALKPSFGVAKHFLPSKDAEKADAVNINKNTFMNSFVPT